MTGVQTCALPISGYLSNIGTQVKDMDIRMSPDADKSMSLKNKISNVQVGLVTEGVVESLQPYGAFVDLGNGLSGLVHISQICEKRIKKPSEALAVGDRVKVKVTAVKDGKLSLSIKEATDMMAKEIEEEVIELPDSKEEASTSLGALFANLKL